tara:strand:+ start:93 stop:269 length:177 start_codon:yes stop_codon:yes gene_type:complete
MKIKKKEIKKPKLIKNVDSKITSGLEVIVGGNPPMEGSCGAGEAGIVCDRAGASSGTL